MSAVDETARDLLAAQAVAVNEQADDIEALAKRVEELAGLHVRLEQRVTAMETFVEAVRAELAPKCPTCGKPH